MKKQTIWIIVGVVVLILIIANWNKIFGKGNGTASSFGPGGRVARPGQRSANDCVCDPPCSGKYNICTCSGTSTVGSCGSLDPSVSKYTSGRR